MKSLQKIIHPDLLNGSIIKSLLAFLLPIIISQVFQQLYNAADTVIVGHYLHENSLAAIGASASLFELLVGFGNGFGNGLSIVVARAYGAEKPLIVKKAVATSLLITAGITVLIMVISRIFLIPLLTLLGTPEEIINQSFDYISTVTLFCGVLFAYNLLAGLLRAIGNSFVPLIFLIISSLINILLDVIFITKLSMGVKGTAIATVIAQFISVILCLIYIFNKTKILIPSRKHFIPDARIYRDMLGQGMSMACMGSIVSSGSVIVQSAINGLGTQIIAGHIAARKIFSIVTIPILTLGMASSTFVSQNLGAGKIDRIKKGVRGAKIITSCWTVVLLIVLPLILRPLLQFLTGSTNETILNYATKYIMFMIPFYFVLGGLIVTRNALQGLGSKLLPLISSVIELLGKILFTIFVIPKLGQTGVILCEPLIWCVMFAQLIFVYLRHPVIRSQNKNS